MDEVGGGLGGHRIVEVAPGRWLGTLLLAFRIRSQYPGIRKVLRLLPRDIFRARSGVTFFRDFFCRAH